MLWKPTKTKPGTCVGYYIKHSFIYSQHMITKMRIALLFILILSFCTLCVEASRWSRLKSASVDIARKAKLPSRNSRVAMYKLKAIVKFQAKHTIDMKDLRRTLLGGNLPKMTNRKSISTMVNKNKKRLKDIIPEDQLDLVWENMGKMGKISKGEEGGKKGIIIESVTNEKYFFENKGLRKMTQDELDEIMYVAKLDNVRNNMASESDFSVINMHDADISKKKVVI